MVILVMVVLEHRFPSLTQIKITHNISYIFRKKDLKHRSYHNIFHVHIAWTRTIHHLIVQVLNIDQKILRNTNVSFT